jgi:hypothetical protein
LTKNETDSELMNTIIKNVNNYNWDILYSCEEPLILKELLFDWLTNSIEYVFNPENISKINENLSNFEKELKTCEYQTLLIIVKFIKLIQDKDEDKEIENQRKIFIENISKYFLGYTSEEDELNDEESENVDKLVNLINLIFNKKKDINEEEDENKNEILYNVYEQLKEHFENNPNKKKLEIEQDNENGDFFNKINNLMNSIRDQSINTPKKENNKAKTNKNISSSLKKENDISNNDSINLRNFNSSTIQLSKTMKINLRKNKSLFRESIEVINEIEQNKDIPWIREEDC